MTRAVILTACVNGGRTDAAERNPHLPVRPEEIAAAVAEAAALGAAVAHFHVRDPATGLPSNDLSLWRETVGLIRAAGTSILLNLSASIGPHSAGADPGPACFGRGGDAPTLTDAHVIRQTIRPEAFFGGAAGIDAAAARAVFEGIAEQMGMSVEEAADSAIELANSNIVRAIQYVSTERGLDPRDYVLVPYGGAGPLHAAAVAEILGISKVVVPPRSGVLSAYGLLASDFTQFDSMTRRILVDHEAPARVLDAYHEMRSAALVRASELGVGSNLAFNFVANMRVVGQAFELAIDLSEHSLASLTTDSLLILFSEAHERAYFFKSDPNQVVEIVSFRLGTTVETNVAPVLSEGTQSAISSREIDLFINRGWQRGQLVSRSSIDPGAFLKGPAILEDPTSTLLVPNGWTARRDEVDSIILAREMPDV